MAVGFAEKSIVDLKCRRPRRVIAMKPSLSAYFREKKAYVVVIA
jgi:hypothetical protein